MKFASVLAALTIANANGQKRHHAIRRVQEDQSMSMMTQPICSVCGDGNEVGNPDAVLSFPGVPLQCIGVPGLLGVIPPPQCAVLPQLISTVCECQSSLPDVVARNQVMMLDVHHWLLK